MPLSDIVNVQITRQTQSVSEMGFGIPMILGANKNWNDLIRKYSNIQDVGVDFGPYTPEYIAAQNVFAQNITPQFLYIGRRTVDTVSVEVETALPNFQYTTTINGTAVQIPSTTAVQDSVVTLSGIVTATITYGADFGTDNIITTTINGATLSPITWATSQANTLTLIANQIAALPAVTSATPGTDSVVVVFVAASSALVNSSVVTGTSAPSTTITYLGPLITSNVINLNVNGSAVGPVNFTTNNLTTMNLIGTAIANHLNIGFTPGVAVVTVSGPNNNVLNVVSNPNQNGLITGFIVTSGSSQATAAIVNSNQPTSTETIANAMATAITAASLGVTATDNKDGTYTVTAVTPGVPYTIAVSTTIINPDVCRISITQAIPGQAYTVFIEGIAYTYQAPITGADNDTISLGLVALINALVPPITGSKLYPVTASDNGNGTFEIEADVSGNAFRVQVAPFEAMTIQFGLILGPYVPSASVVTDLEAIQDVNDDWYALACTDRTSATVQAIAAWIETQIKIFGTASSDTNIINQPPGPGGDTTSIAYLLFNAGYARSFVLYYEDANEDYPECAWFGNCLPLQPGSETWKFKTLNTITYSDLSTNQENNAFQKKCNTYEYVGGVGITQNGTVAAGEFIDIIRGIDWLTSTIQTYVYSILVNSPKIPYTNAGITAVEGQIRQVLQIGIDNNFIASEPPIQISVPNALTVPSIDKANRVLNNVRFQATLAGAIQAVFITGTVSV